jgi:LDH2 family malate/lactate/ureidoglycolate dehydrogenase
MQIAFSPMTGKKGRRVETVSPERVRLSAAEARELAVRSLSRIGYDDEEAGIVADHVMDAALCGYEYSGLPKILNVAEHKRLRQPRRLMKAVRETPVSVRFDGGNNVGMVAQYRATCAAIEKAREHGFAVVGVNNSWLSGRSALYVELIARAGLIGIHTVSSTRHVAPPGAARASIGTNPIAFGFPTLADPVVIDLGTSAFMSTDLEFRIRRHELLPEDVAIDQHGNPTRDPVLARLGALLTFGGYKGFAIAVAMRALGVLAGAGDDVEQTYGYLTIAIKPDLLVDLDDYRRYLTAAIEEIKATPRQPGVDEIRIPSERSFRDRRRNLRDGIVIDRHIYEALLALPQGRLR